MEFVFNQLLLTLNSRWNVYIWKHHIVYLRMSTLLVRRLKTVYSRIEIKVVGLSYTYVYMNICMYLCIYI
jgi:hypothetical protein